MRKREENWALRAAHGGCTAELMDNPEGNGVKVEVENQGLRDVSRYIPPPRLQLDCRPTSEHCWEQPQHMNNSS